MAKTIRQIAETPTEIGHKLTFWKKEEINAKSDLRDGLSDLREALQTGKPLNKMVRASVKANKKISFNRSKFFHAKKQRLKLEASIKKSKKYWK